MNEMKKFYVLKMKMIFDCKKKPYRLLEELRGNLPLMTSRIKLCYEEDEIHMSTEGDE